MDRPAAENTFGAAENPFGPPALGVRGPFTALAGEAGIRPGIYAGWGKTVRCCWAGRTRAPFTGLLGVAASAELGPVPTSAPKRVPRLNGVRRPKRAAVAQILGLKPRLRYDTFVYVSVPIDGNRSLAIRISRMAHEGP